ncbi:MAG: hypothetical protein IT426_00415 [Pirellulales bacterium]|nr:hypothetical protein [Pirellulales bacterium]
MNCMAMLEACQEHKPKMIVAGAIAYPREMEHGKFAENARSCGAKLSVDMAHYGASWRSRLEKAARLERGPPRGPLQLTSGFRPAVPEFPRLPLDDLRQRRHRRGLVLGPIFNGPIFSGSRVLMPHRKLVTVHRGLSRFSRRKR